MGDSDHLTFAVEQWSDDGQRIEEVLARAGNVILARAAYEAAVKLRPERWIMLRQRAHVIASSRRD